MRTVGVICEWNPFHNGHRYFLECLRQSGATHLVAAMSGSFVQRGEAAWADKFLRAEAAVRCGVDLVLDLPVPWSLGGAQSFARGGVSLLYDLGCRMLAFGCETDDAAALRRAAQLLSDEQLSEEAALRMRRGLSYPAAVKQTLLERKDAACARLLETPNNVLAVEYIKASRSMNKPMEFLPVKRIGPGHDMPVADGWIQSASAIRALPNMVDARPYIPAAAYDLLAQNEGRLLSSEAYETAMLSVLRLQPQSAFDDYVDDRSGLADRLAAAVKSTASLQALYDAAKTKSLTHAKIRREVLHTVLRIPQDFAKGTPTYARVLAANERGLEILAQNAAALPVITKHAETASLSARAQQLYALQCRAEDLYAVCTKEKGVCCKEQTTSIRIIRPECR